MSRRRRSSNSSISRPDAEFLSPPLTRPRVVQDFAPAPLTLIEDRRTYHPLGDDRYPRSFVSPSHARQVVTPKPFRVAMPFGTSFAVPETVAVCVRRKSRKEVLHALRKTGKGKGRRRNPRRTWVSKIGC